MAPMASMTALRRFDAAQKPRILRSAGGKVVELNAHDVRFMIWSEESDGGVALVEYSVPPRTLAAPLHRHANEDEYSYVLEGQMGVQRGNNVAYAEPGDLVFKPRNQWHTFWNAGDQPCRALEIISPGGFEHIFDDVAALMADANAEDMATEADAWSALNARYSLDVDLESTPHLCKTHDLVYPE